MPPHTITLTHTHTLLPPLWALQYLLGGLAEIDVEDWRKNTDYVGYSPNDTVVVWFWRAVESWDDEMRARLLQFVTGTSKVPMNGFAELQGEQLLDFFTLIIPSDDSLSLLSYHIVTPFMSYCNSFHVILSLMSCHVVAAVGSNGPRKFCLKRYGQPGDLPRSHTW